MEEVKSDDVLGEKAAAVELESTVEVDADDDTMLEGSLTMTSLPVAAAEDELVLAGVHRHPEAVQRW